MRRAKISEKENRPPKQPYRDTKPTTREFRIPFLNKLRSLRRRELPPFSERGDTGGGRSPTSPNEEPPFQNPTSTDGAVFSRFNEYLPTRDRYQPIPRLVEVQSTSRYHPNDSDSDGELPNYSLRQLSSSSRSTLPPGSTPTSSISMGSEEAKSNRPALKSSNSLQSQSHSKSDKSLRFATRNSEPIRASSLNSPPLTSNPSKGIIKSEKSKECVSSSAHTQHFRSQLQASSMISSPPKNNSSKQKSTTCVLSSASPSSSQSRHKCNTSNTKTQPGKSKSCVSSSASVSSRTRNKIHHHRCQSRNQQRQESRVSFSPSKCNSSNTGSQPHKSKSCVSLSASASVSSSRTRHKKPHRCESHNKHQESRMISPPSKCNSSNMGAEPRKSKSCVSLCASASVSSSRTRHKTLHRCESRNKHKESSRMLSPPLKCNSSNTGVEPHKSKSCVSSCASASVSSSRSRHKKPHRCESRNKRQKSRMLSPPSKCNSSNTGVKPHKSKSCVSLCASASISSSRTQHKKKHRCESTNKGRLSRKTSSQSTCKLRKVSKQSQRNNYHISSCASASSSRGDIGHKKRQRCHSSKKAQASARVSSPSTCKSSKSRPHPRRSKSSASSCASTTSRNKYQKHRSHQSTNIPPVDKSRRKLHEPKLIRKKTRECVESTPKKRSTSKRRRRTPKRECVESTPSKKRSTSRRRRRTPKKESSLNTGPRHADCELDKVPDKCSTAPMGWISMKERYRLMKPRYTNEPLFWLKPRCCGDLLGGNFDPNQDTRPEWPPDKHNEPRQDFLLSNALKVVRQPAKIPIPKYQDHATGKVSNWCASGLARKYIFKRDYGKVPAYLTSPRKQNYCPKGEDEINFVLNLCRHQI